MRANRVLVWYNVFSTKKYILYRRGVVDMTKQTDRTKQLPNGINSVFNELKILHHLRSAGITKSMGYTCSHIFKLIFCLFFQNKNWWCLLDADRADDLPANDAVYRQMCRVASSVLRPRLRKGPPL